MRRSFVGLIVLVMLCVTVLPIRAAPAARPLRAEGRDQSRRPVIFFTSDGLRQDLVERYARDGGVRNLQDLLRKGARAGDNGLLTEAPPNTGAGWYTLATGAWPGVHGSTNNTFHINGAAFASSTSSFTPGILQAETIAQAAERGGLKVAQIEWSGGRIGSIQGPTLDYRSFLSGRGVATNYVSPDDNAALISSFGLQFDHPAGFAGQAPFAGAAPVSASGWTNVPTSYSPAQEMRLRVLDFGTDKYGLNAYIYDSTNNHRTNYDRVLFSFSKDGGAAVANLRAGEWADVKVKVVGGSLDGLTAGFLVKVERLARDLSQVRLFHSSVARVTASWPTWPGETGFSGDFAEYLSQRFPSSTGADYAILEAGIVSEETYVQQALGWETSYQPIIRYILSSYKPDLAMIGYPLTDEFQHQFLGLVTPRLPNGQPNPAYDDVQVNGTPDGRVKQREGFIRRAYEGADRTLGLTKQALRQEADTFVASDHGFAPQFLAVDASKVLCRPRPARQAADSELPPRQRRDDWQGEGLLGRWHGADLPQPGRTRPGGRRPPAGACGRRGGDGRPDQGRLPGPDRPERLDARWPARGLEADRPRLHQGRGPRHPQRPRQHRRYGLADPHRRPGGLCLPALPVRCGNARHPGSRARPSSASTATCPTCRTSRRTSICGRPSSRAARTSRRASIAACAASTSRRRLPTCSAPRCRSRPRAACSPNCSTIAEVCARSTSLA